MIHRSVSLDFNPIGLVRGEICNNVNKCPFGLKSLVPSQVRFRDKD